VFVRQVPGGADPPLQAGASRTGCIGGDGQLQHRPAPAEALAPGRLSDGPAGSRGWHAFAVASAVGDLLSIEPHGEVALVTLQRPEKRNALSIELRIELAEAFGRLSDGANVGCIVLTGAGPAFCSGMDVTQFGGDREHKRRLVETSALAFEAVGRCTRPVVAAVNGPALAGGFALALLCDLRIASERATFGYPELPRGIPPSYAAARAVLPATVAQDLCLTGRIIDAEEALRLGVVREVASGDPVEAGLALGQRVAGLPRDAVLETKRRTLLERDRLWGFLFEDERKVFARALLGEEPEPAG
jgi:enoyl-CoA hydratase/carnithine racemase